MIKQLFLPLEGFSGPVDDAEMIRAAFARFGIVVKVEMFDLADLARDLLVFAEKEIEYLAPLFEMSMRARLAFVQERVNAGLEDTARAKRGKRS